MEFTQYRDRMMEFTQKQDTEWEVFLDYFRGINPEPARPEIIRAIAVEEQVSISLKFWLALASGIGALFLSGFRVSERFFIVAGGDNVNPFFSYGEAISGVLAVNVTIFALAIAYAYSAKKMSESSQWLGLGTAILISAVAGLGQAANALGPEWAGVVSFFDLILAGVLGLGATALEYFSGDLLGVEIVLFLAERKRAKELYKAEQLQNEQNYSVLSEKAEQDFVLLHKEWVRLAKSQFGLWKANFLKWNEQTERERSVSTEQNKPNRTSSSGQFSFADLVRSVLEQNYQANNSVLSFGELSSVLSAKVAEQQGITEQDAEEFGRQFLAKKKAQISELRTKWIKENNL